MISHGLKTRTVLNANGNISDPLQIYQEFSKLTSIKTWQLLKNLLPQNSYCESYYWIEFCHIEKGHASEVNYSKYSTSVWITSWVLSHTILS